MVADNKHQTGELESNENIINLPEHCAKKDPAGTDPNRYKYVSSAKNTSNSEAGSTDDDYNREPKNHTTTDERLLNPDRGENN